MNHEDYSEDEVIAKLRNSTKYIEDTQRFVISKEILIYMGYFYFKKLIYSELERIIHKEDILPLC